MAIMTVLDRFERPLASVRVSVTDRCNLRCRYCMPEDEYLWLPRQSLLSFEEIARIGDVFAELGVHKLRLTGGEPLLRRDLGRLVRLLAEIPGIDDLALTTNGLLLARHAGELRAAGLHRVTVSLDTLRENRFRTFAKSAHHADVLDGIEAAGVAGFTQTKLNSVIVRGFNDDEIADLLAFGREHEVEVRFIEYMDVGGATRWSFDDVVPARQILATIERAFGPATPASDTDEAAPADRFLLPDGTTFGVIASTTQPFCRTCDRSRLTADGMWYLCLYAATGIDLKSALREGATPQALATMIRDAWTARRDRGAEERLARPERGPLYQLDGLRADPHREMHTRGG